ncbi:MAG: hypothetical protein ACFCUI_01065 [Bernardetiaceae bacterium]
MHPSNTPSKSDKRFVFKRLQERRAALERQEAEVSDTNLYLTNEDMTVRESLTWAIIGGLLAALIGAFAWAESTIILEKDLAYDPQHAYMSVLVGLVVGLAVRFLGRGRHPRFGVVAVVLAILGCLLGNTFSSIAYVVATLKLSYFTVIQIFDLSQLYGFIADRFAYLDILFYSIALLVAYFFSMRGSVDRTLLWLEVQIDRVLQFWYAQTNR